MQAPEWRQYEVIKHHKEAKMTPSITSCNSLRTSKKTLVEVIVCHRTQFSSQRRQRRVGLWGCANPNCNKQSLIKTPLASPSTRINTWAARLGWSRSSHHHRTRSPINHCRCRRRVSDTSLPVPSPSLNMAAATGPSSTSSVKKETLPPALGSTSQPPPVFDGTTRQITILLFNTTLNSSLFVSIPVRKVKLLHWSDDKPVSNFFLFNSLAWVKAVHLLLLPVRSARLGYQELQG